MHLRIESCGMQRLALGLLYIMSVLPSWSQSLARLTGTVADKTGAVVVGAKVAARNVATGVISDATTNESGVYLFPFLPPAEYEVTSELQGFKKAVRSGVVLETATTRTLDFAMEVGAVTESVEVNATVPLLESETSSVGQFIERTTVINMPLESRRTAGLVKLMGMVAFREESGAEQVPLSVWLAEEARTRFGSWMAATCRTRHWACRSCS